MKHQALVTLVMVRVTMTTPNLTIILRKKKSTFHTFLLYNKNS